MEDKRNVIRAVKQFVEYFANDPSTNEFTDYWMERCPATITVTKNTTAGDVKKAINKVLNGDAPYCFKHIIRHFIEEKRNSKSWLVIHCQHRFFADHIKRILKDNPIPDPNEFKNLHEYSEDSGMKKFYKFWEKNSELSYDDAMLKFVESKIQDENFMFFNIKSINFSDHIIQYFIKNLDPEKDKKIDNYIENFYITNKIDHNVKWADLLLIDYDFIEYIIQYKIIETFDLVSEGDLDKIINSTPKDFLRN